MQRNGFTLVELLVSSIIAVFVGISIYTMVQLSVSQSSAGSLDAISNIRYDNTIQQIAYSIRRSNCALKSSELWPPCSLAVDTNVSAIYLKNANGSDTGGYQISSGILQERILSGGTWTWQNFKMGDTAVTVTSGSRFMLSSDRKRVYLVLNTMCVIGKCRDTVFSHGESFLCRN
jgi:hypothetical protein